MMKGDQWKSSMEGSRVDDRALCCEAVKEMVIEGGRVIRVVKRRGRQDSDAPIKPVLK